MVDHATVPGFLPCWLNILAPLLNHAARLLGNLQRYRAPGKTMYAYGYCIGVIKLSFGRDLVPSLDVGVIDNLNLWPGKRHRRRRRRVAPAQSHSQCSEKPQWMYALHGS